MNQPILAQTRILFFGTPMFAVPALRALHETGASLLCVTNPDKAVGRNKVFTAPPVKLEAIRCSMHIIQPQRIDEQLLKELRLFNPNVAVLAAYGKIIPPELLALPHNGFVNVHPSLLPQYRGASPIAGAILAGEKKTGVTIMKMDERLDHGPILAQRTVQLNGTETAGTLTKTLAVLGSSLLLEVFPQYLAGTLRSKPQDEGEATMTHVLRKEDARIDWKRAAIDVERRIRAHHPWPVAWTLCKGKALKIHRAKIFTLQKTDSPGKLVVENGRLVVSCGDGGALELLEVQQEGRRRLSAPEFLNGNARLLPTMLDEKCDHSA